MKEPKTLQVDQPAFVTLRRNTMLKPRLEIEAGASAALEAEQALSSAGVPITVTSVDFAGELSIQATVATTPPGTGGSPMTVTQNTASSLTRHTLDTSTVTPTPSTNLGTTSQATTSSVTTQSTSPVLTSSHNSGPGPTIGIAVGVSVAVSLIAILLLFMYRRIRKRRNNQETQAQKAAWEQWEREEHERTEALEADGKYTPPESWKGEEKDDLDSPGVTGTSPPHYSNEKFGFGKDDRPQKYAGKAPSLGPNDSVSEAEFLQDPDRRRLSFSSSFVRTDIAPKFSSKNHHPWKQQVPWSHQTAPASKAPSVPKVPDAAVLRSNTNGSIPQSSGGESHEEHKTYSAPQTNDITQKFASNRQPTSPSPPPRLQQPSNGLPKLNVNTTVPRPIQPTESTSSNSSPRPSFISSTSINGEDTPITMATSMTTVETLRSQSPKPVVADLPRAHTEGFHPTLQRADSAHASVVASSVAMPQSRFQNSSQAKLDAARRQAAQRDLAPKLLTPTCAGTPLTSPPNAGDDASQYTNPQVSRIVDLYRDDASEQPMAEDDTVTDKHGFTWTVTDEERRVKRELEEVYPSSSVYDAKRR
ncbi:MAG: hypothetical protein M1828_006303 [Chrysothrix sp. TS-e1954]|nr:MAG: hypothetical protein M1828_006303 [Chrysothrix sp. TS-e1954]